MNKKPGTSTPKSVKKDADSAFAPCQADGENEGGLTISTDGDDHPRKKPDDHSAPTTPQTDDKPSQ